jgi:hypothetical protein
VFFFGKEVNDFHTIDKNQIFALHHSAIQELSRKNDEKTIKIMALEELNAQKDEKIHDIETRILRIEQNQNLSQINSSTSLFKKV